MTTWAYPVIMLAALVAGSLLLRRNQRQLPLTGVQKLGLGLGAFCGSMLLARLPFIWLGPDDPSGPLWISGKTITLGIAGGYFGVELAKLAFGVTQRTGDSFAVPIAVAIAIGRLGCLAAGCCYGLPTDLPWGIHFESVDGSLPIRRHPMQLYEFAFHLTAAGLLLWVQRRLYGPNQPPTPGDHLWRGNLIKIYFLAYFAFRLVSEWGRPEPAVAWGLSIYQWISLVLMALFGLLWWWSVTRSPMRKRQPS